VTDPKHPINLDDPDSIPVLTDVIVPGRPPTPRREETPAPSGTPKVEPSAESPTGARTEAQTEPSIKPSTEPSFIASTEPLKPSTPADVGPARGEPVTEAVRAAEIGDFVEGEPERQAQAVAGSTARAAASEPHEPLLPAELSERDAEHIAERLRVRFANYLRGEGRRVIEARCNEALEEHASWLVRQVTREVALALEGEVSGWVRDALRAELAAHQPTRR
jgi:hypothetical protein